MSEPRTKIYYMLTRDVGGTMVFYKAVTPNGWLDRYETREDAENALFFVSLGETNSNVKYDIMELELPNPNYKEG